MRREYIEEEMDAAEECLSDARIMSESGVSDRAVASRLYYACYHAAKSALYSRDINPRSHKGLVSLFGEEIVDGETVTREDATFLSRSQSRREQADYEQKPVEEDLEQLAQKTKEFIQKMKEVVEK